MKKTIFIICACICVQAALADLCDFVVTKSTTHGGTIQTAYDPSTNQVTLTAVPDDGYEFKMWEEEYSDGDHSYISDNNPFVFTYSGESAYRAVFLRSSDVNFAGGPIIVDRLEYYGNYLYSISVPESEEWCSDDIEFEGWYYSSTGNDNDFEFETSDLSNIGDLESYRRVKSHMTKTYEIKETDRTYGHIETAVKECQYILTAVPDDGCTFLYWNDDHSNTNPVRKVDYAEGDYAASFANPPVQGDDVYYNSIAEALTAGATNIAMRQNLTEDIEIATGKSINLTSNGKSLTGDIMIRNGGKLTLVDAANATDLYIEAKASTSGQLLNPTNLTLTGDAYIDITLEEEGDPNKWYAVALPFEVDGATGVYSTDGVQQTSPANYTFCNYNGSTRATTGKGWSYPYTGTLNPGTFYMFGFNGTANTWRFKKNQAAALAFTGKKSLSAFPSSDANNAGWNPVGNPTLHYATTTADVAMTYICLYNNATSSYQTETMANYNLVVGRPFFVQTAGVNALSFAIPSALAPQRAEETEAAIRVSISNDSYEDAMFLTINDEATDTYVLGKDLAKLRSNNVPQIWTRAYDMNLAAQDATWSGTQTTFDLSMNAPTSGTYTLKASSNIDCNVYLMSNNVVIYDLSQGNYSFELDKSVNEQYQLLISTNVGVNTSLDKINATDCKFKFIQNGNLYIKNGNHTFNAQGSVIQ